MIYLDNENLVTVPLLQHLPLERLHLLRQVPPQLMPLPLLVFRAISAQRALRGLP